MRKWSGCHEYQGDIRLYIMLEIDKTHNIDNVQGMKLLDDECIDLTVTSPPYDNLRNYNGFSFDFEDGAKELFRVTKKGGVVVWIVSDATIDGSETGTSFKQALYFMQCGFNLHDTMIWCKDGGGAVGSNLCYTQNYEYMFVFSKGKPHHINLIKDKLNQSFGMDRSGVGRRTKDGVHKIENRKPNEQFSKRNNWWLLVPQEQEGSKWHPAVFPEDLARDHIKSWSDEGDLVLDPFMGSGTTAKMALQLNRHYIGFEISKEYCNLAEKRVLGEKSQLKLF